MRYLGGDQEPCCNFRKGHHETCLSCDSDRTTHVAFEVSFHIRYTRCLVAHERDPPSNRTDGLIVERAGVCFAILCLRPDGDDQLGSLAISCSTRDTISFDAQHADIRASASTSFVTASLGRPRCARGGARLSRRPRLRAPPASARSTRNAPRPTPHRGAP